MKAGWEYVELSEAIEKQSSNISRKKIADEIGDFPVFGAKGLEKSISYFQQEKEYLAIIKDGAGIGRLSKRPAKSSVLATLQYLVPRTGFHIDFVKYFLLNVDFEKYRVGSTIPHIYWKHYKVEKIPKLPLAEQKQIVSVLDQAFAGIERAAEAARKNRDNARELFETTLNATFTQKGEGWVETTLGDLIEIKHGFAFKSEFFADAGDFVLLTPGNFYESGGYRDRGQKQKFYVGGVPDGYLLEEGAMLFAMTEQAVGLLGSTMITPEGGKYLHNQRLGLIEVKDACAWNNEFFFYQFSTKHFRAEVQDSASGLKVRHTSPKKLQSIVVSYPENAEIQRKIALELYDLSNQTQRLEALYQQKLDVLEELKQSLLQKAIVGELTAEQTTLDATSPAFAANVIAFGFRQHAKNQQSKTYGRVKAQKTLHLVESIGGIDLGRDPIKDAAGPNDSAHARAAENWAKTNQFFEFVRRDIGPGYVFVKLARYDELMAKAERELGGVRAEIDKAIAPLVYKNTEAAEVFTTVHAAWNNLIIDDADISDEAIVREAREDWHTDKLNISRNKFFDAITDIRKRGLEPSGIGKRVGEQQGGLL